MRESPGNQYRSILSKLPADRVVRLVLFEVILDDESTLHGKTNFQTPGFSLYAPSVPERTSGFFLAISLVHNSSIETGK